MYFHPSRNTSQALMAHLHSMLCEFILCLSPPIAQRGCVTLYSSVPSRPSYGTFGAFRERSRLYGHLLLSMSWIPIPICFGCDTASIFVRPPLTTCIAMRQSYSRPCLPGTAVTKVTLYNTLICRLASSGNSGELTRHAAAIAIRRKAQSLVRGSKATDAYDKEHPSNLQLSEPAYVRRCGCCRAYTAMLLQPQCLPTPHPLHSLEFAMEISLTSLGSSQICG